MIREDGRVLARSWVVFTSTVGLALALAAPLLATAAEGTAPATGVAVMALIVTALIAFSSLSARLPGRAVSVCALGSVSQQPLVTAEITDPPRHPLRPRAPGLD